jgi:hypothetical protein
MSRRAVLDIALSGEMRKESERIFVPSEWLWDEMMAVSLERTAHIYF